MKWETTRGSANIFILIRSRLSISTRVQHLHFAVFSGESWEQKARSLHHAHYNVYSSSNCPSGSFLMAFLPADKVQ